jgi:hypothetical protein
MTDIQPKKKKKQWYKRPKKKDVSTEAKGEVIIETNRHESGSRTSCR